MVLERSRAGVMQAGADVAVSAAGEPATEPVQTSNLAAADELASPFDEAAPAPEHTSDPSGSLVVALVQLYPRLGDVPANLATHLSAIVGASANGAGLVVFPELSLTGYFLKDQVPEVALRLESPEIDALRAASQEGPTDIVAGFILESDAHQFYNASVYISGGDIVHVHRKVYLPTYGLFDEQRYVSAGDRFRAFDAPLGGRTEHRWRAGILICEDLWHPTAASLLARQGIDVLICPSASPGRGVLQGEGVGTAGSYDAMTRTYAQLFTTYVLYCNRSGFEDGVGFWGGSRVVDPAGAVSASLDGAHDAVLMHTLDRSAVRRARVAYPLLRDERNDVNDSETDRLRRRHARG